MAAGDRLKSHGCPPKVRQHGQQSALVAVQDYF